MTFPSWRMKTLASHFRRDKFLLLLLIVPIASVFVFSYLPMFGLVIAFQNYRPGDSFFQSASWAGLDNFIRFFDSPYAWRLIRNTVLLNVYSILFSMPVPIVFALCINEMRNRLPKKICQTISYFPHFISTVVLVGLVTNFFSTGGIVNTLLGTDVNFFADPKYFRGMFVGSGIWASFGWNSILYLAAISAIDPTLYEAARVDGASRFQQMRFITLPSIVPTFCILFILTIGSLFSLGPDKALLLQTPAIYETADIISTYVYRSGIVEGQYSFSTAIGMMNAAVNFLLLVTFNKIAQKLQLASFW